jgi:hypothetical protein
MIHTRKSVIEHEKNIMDTKKIINRLGHFNEFPNQKLIGKFLMKICNINKFLIKILL